MEDLRREAGLLGDGAPGPLPRTLTRRVHVGPVAVGGGAPVAVQSMTCKIGRASCRERVF